MDTAQTLRKMIEERFYRPEERVGTPLHSAFMCNALDLAAANGLISLYERNEAKKAIHYYMYTLGSDWTSGTLAATLNSIHPAHLPVLFPVNSLGNTSDFYHTIARAIFGDWQARPKSPEAYVTFATKLFNKEA